jgi:biotin synthase
MRNLIDKLYREKVLSKVELVNLLRGIEEGDIQYLFSNSRAVADKFFGNKIYVRGLIEFTNFCKNDCYYCGIRKSNLNAQRYRLNKDEILSCCKQGYELGFRTFVLQGGEDLWYSDEEMIDIISSIRNAYRDCAITLSLGEKTYEQYLKFYNAGADRYLLRHETANLEHYSKIHPSELSGKSRQRCLYDLKRIGYQVGTGFMVGSPYQTIENLAEDLLFIKELEPQMVGIGPFIPHKDTPFANSPSGQLELTLILIGILRLMLPNSLIPSTTALGTIHPEGRERGILAGANVVMPNLSPVEVRNKYLLYDNKICTGEEAAECRHCLEGRMNKIGYKLVVDRGDFCPME